MESSGTTYSVLAVVTDLEKTSHHGESVLDFDIWGPLDFELSLIFDRIEEPVPDASGNQPSSNDLRMTAGLSLDF